MVLDDNTFEKVASLLRLPKNTVEYHGSYGSTVDFFVGIKTSDRDYVCGCLLRVTQDLKIHSVRRLSITEGYFTKAWPVRRRNIPLYIDGALNQ